jgi:hypothetical protein
MTTTLDLVKNTPKGPVSISDMKGPDGPTIHLEGTKPYDLPKSGTATVKFRLRRVTTEVAEGRYEVCIELLSMKDIKGSGGPAIKADTETSDALDALRDEKIEGYAEEED